MSKFIVFTVQGGIGKNVLATAVVAAIKKAHPDRKIIVLTAYKDVWLFNPNCHRVFAFGQMQYFYQDYVLGKDTLIFSNEPYATQDYLLKKKHLIEIWCNLCGVPFDNELPEMHFNMREVEYVKNLIVGDSKIMIVQTNGGMQQDVKISWMRDLPLDIAQKVVNHFCREYKIFHVRRDDQPSLQNTHQLTVGIRELALTVRFSEKRLLIDSLCQHFAAALKKPSTVVWVGNAPEMLGYTMHDNIITSAEEAFPHSLMHSVLEPYEITGNVQQCPYPEGTVLFNAKEIIDSIIAQKNQLA